MRFAIRRSDNQLTDGLSGAPIGTSQNPIIFPRANTTLLWQVAEDYGPGGSYQMPLLLPADTAWTLKFKLVGEFEGDAVIEIGDVTAPTTGNGTGFLINATDGFVAGDTALVLDTGSGTILAGDVITIGAHAYAVASALASNIVRIAAPGLIDDVADNTPVNITGSMDYYSAVLGGNSDAAQTALLTPDGNASNDIPSISLASEMTWATPDDPPGEPSMSQPVFATLRNVYFDDGDTSPSPAKGTPVQFLRTIDDYIGGSANQLDSVATLVTPVPSLFEFVHSSGALKVYELVAGTNAESSPDVIRPDDYATTTNEKVWKLKPGGGDAQTSGNLSQFATGGAISVATVNGNTLTTGTYTLTGAASKVLTFNSTLTLGGTDGATVTVGANISTADNFCGGGPIDTSGGTGGSSVGGAINTSGSQSNGAAAGGAINTSGGSAPGGPIDTHDGGGQVNTHTGVIELGPAGSTRVTVTIGSGVLTFAQNGNTVTLPLSASGTVTVT